MVFILLFSAVGQVGAATTVTTKFVKSYEIAVVFDNSGSMYTNEAWCRAKYAMEIFASMLDYGNGDKLKVFPMWDVKTDGSQTADGGSYRAIEINDISDIDKLSNLFTVAPAGTPFEPVTEAYEYLKTSTANEKWLIVLTDGEFNRESRSGEETIIDLQQRLPTFASSDIKVQYLGFGEAPNLMSNEANYFFAKKSSDISLKDDLVNICNSIFKRDSLPQSSMTGNVLHLDLSMRSVIVFAQGSEARILSLTDSSGNNIAVSMDSGQRKYSEIRAGGYMDAPVDRTLAGQVVTFSQCPAGEYTLSYSGAESVQIFYEPFVDINITLTKPNGEPEDYTDGHVETGDYLLHYNLVDAVTRKDVSTSPLMGKVTMGSFVRYSDGTEIPIENGGTINFTPDTLTNLVVYGTYLNDYLITTEDNPDAFPPFSVDLPKAEKLTVKTVVKQSNSWYVLSDHEDWEPIILEIRSDGQPLTDERLQQMSLQLKFSDDLTYHTEILEGQSAYAVHIGYDENGNYKKPETGNYKLTATASAVDEYDRTITADSDTKFDIEWYALFWRWLLILLAIAAIIFLIVYIGTRKTLPKKVGIRFEHDGITRDVRMFKKSPTLLSSAAFGRTLSGMAKPLTNRFASGSTRAAFEFTNLSKPPFGVMEFTIGNKRYIFDDEENSFFEEDRQSDDPVDFRNLSFQISDGTSISWVYQDPTSLDELNYNGKIKINQK